MPKRVRPKQVRKVGVAQSTPSRIHPLVIPILLVVIVVCVFGQTVRHDFINYDDDQYVYGNPRISNGLSFEGIRWAFTHVQADNWHPLTTISHMLDCQIFGLQPWGHHLINVLLHAATAVLLFLALMELTGLRWPSAFVAGLFAIHPLRVESVAWVAERKDVLSGVFFMLTLWSYARYVRGSRAWLGRYAVAVVFFALGLLCKPTLVTVPFVLLLLDFWPLRRFATGSPGSESSPPRASPPTRSVQYLVIEKLPFFLLSAASSVATILAQEKAIQPSQALNLAVRVGNAMISYVIYIGQVIWPAGLCPLYPYQSGGHFIFRALLAGLLVLTIAVVFLVWRRKYPFLLIGWLWFLGVLVPMIGIVQVGSQAHADRYTYLSQIGLYLLLTWGGLELVSRWQRGREALIAIALLTIAGLAMGSFIQTSHWQNSETLWSYTLVHTSNNALAQTNLGQDLMKKERLDEATFHLEEALRIQPDHPEAHNILGYVLIKKGQPNDAVAHFQRALELKPELKNAEYNLMFIRGNALAREGKTEEAVVAYQAALQIQPSDPMLHSNLAAGLVKLGRTTDAIAQLREAVRQNPSFQEGHIGLAALLLQAGQREEAVMHFKEALRLKPNDTRIRAQLRQLGVEE